MIANPPPSAQAILSNQSSVSTGNMNDDRMPFESERDPGTRLSGPTIKVLLVEDEPAHAELIRRSFEDNRRFDLAVTSTLSQARGAIADNPPDLVLADYLLPDGQGVELLPPPGSDLAFPIVIMTSHGDEQLAVEAMKAGALDYVVKSDVSLAEMPQVVDRALREWNHIFERKKAETALQESEQRFRALYDENPSMFFTLDSEGSVLSVNQFGAEALGYAVEDLLWQPFSSLYVEDQREFVERNLRSALETPTEIHRWEACKVRSDDHPVWVRVAARVVHDTERDPSLLIVCEDITEAHNLSEELSYQASHDSLTGLLNRREFERRLVHVLRLTRTEQSQHALCYLDIDQFKVINDTCGHKAGDQLLGQVAKMLQGHVRSRDTLARLGGDEFGVLMEHCSLDDASRVANNLREAVASYRFLWEEQTFGLAASVAVVPINEDSGGLTQILTAADAACYAAKDKGRNRVHIYHEKDAVIARRHGEMQWVSRIHKALEEERFQLFFQPIESLTHANGNLLHGELLLRMLDEDGRIVLPGAFLPAAERYHVIDQIDRWVIAHAFSWLSRNRDCLESSYLWSINLSGHSLGKSGTLEFIVEQLNEKRIPPEKICFEVTETAAIDNLSQAMILFRELRQLGCLFALDDFGTGLSSFGYLKTLPVDLIKIDGIFVRDIVNDPVDSVAVRAINEIAHAMSKQTVAEFVENEATLARVRELGIDYAQGHAVGRPIPLTQLEGEALAR